MHQDDGQARTKPRQRLVERQVPKTKPDTAAQKEERKGASLKSCPDGVTPQAEQDGGQADSPEIS